MLTDPQNFMYNREGRAMSLAVQIKDTNWQLTVSADEKHHSPWSTFPFPVGDAMTRYSYLTDGPFLKPRVFVSKSST